MNLTTNDITMALQNLVDLSDQIFGARSNQEEPTLTNDKEINMEFEGRSLVQGVFGKNNLDE